MDITYYKVENDSIIKTDQDIKHEDWEEKVNWIDIRAKDRKKITTYFHELNLNDQLRECIEKPEAYPFSNTFGKTIILNITVSDTTDFYKPDYITVVVYKHIIFTISDARRNVFTDNILASYSQKLYTSLSNFIFHILALTILAQSNANISIVRKRLQRIELTILNDPDNISSKELISCERDISQLSDIIEDQYIGFDILGSLNPDNLSPEKVQQSSKIIKGFEPLDKAISRLSRKAESLRLQYMLIQQEKSAKKINALTIVQAVFVPITFIAGVYGMNFVHMPELNWEFGYLLVWLIFLLMAGGLLIHFYRKGWFN